MYIVFIIFRVATSSRHYAKWECKHVNTVSRHEVGMLVTRVEVIFKRSSNFYDQLDLGVC